MANRVAKLLALGRGARDLEEYEAALILFRRARELDANSEEAASAVAEIASQLGDERGAIDARLDLVEIYIRKQQLELASEAIDRVLEVDPDEPLALSFRDFVATRLHPEIDVSEGTGQAAPAALADDITGRVASEPSAAAEPYGVAPEEHPAFDESDEDEWEARATAVINAGNMQDLLAQAGTRTAAADPEEPEESWEARATAIITSGNLLDLLAESGSPAAATEPSDDGEFAATPRTIALDGQSAAVALSKLLQSSPLLRALDSPSCTRLLAESEVVQCFAGQEVVEQGTAGTSMFLILEGNAVIERPTHTVESISAGSFFGEASLLGETPRLATLRVTEDALLLEIERSLIKELSASQAGLLPVLAHFLRERAIAIQLAESPILSRIPPALVDEIASLLHLHRIRRGQVVMKHGQVPTGYWEVIVGLLSSVDPQGFAGSDLSAGGHFGGCSARDEPAPVSLTAMTPCWLLELPVADLRKLIERSPALTELLGAS